jgi:ABC-type glycerol-3-phosphate transport system permease component
MKRDSYSSILSENDPLALTLLWNHLLRKFWISTIVTIPTVVVDLVLHSGINFHASSPARLCIFNIAQVFVLRCHIPGVAAFTSLPPC